MKQISQKHPRANRNQCNWIKEKLSQSSETFFSKKKGSDETFHFNKNHFCQLRKKNYWNILNMNNLTFTDHNRRFFIAHQDFFQI